MRIAVVGAGGVGGYFGGRLAKAGVDVTFIARGATLEALRTRGLRVDSIDGDFLLERVNATDDPSSAGEADFVLMTVKACQIAEAAARLAPLIGPGTAVVPLENGIDAPDILSAIVGHEHVLGGLCGIVSYIVEPAHIRHAATEPFVMFGELDHSMSARVERLRDVFRSSGVKADVPGDILHSMWTKFLFIAPLSAIGALTRVPVGEWRTIPELRKIAEASLREMIAVAKMRGVDPGHDALLRTMERYDNLAPVSTSSLQRDVMEGKPSELEAQIGAVVRLAADCGISAPVSSFLYHCLLPQERRARGLV